MLCDIEVQDAPARRAPNVLTGLVAAWRSVQQRRRQRRASIDLISGSAHLLRDLGLDAEHIRARRL
jgi:uncharacterized protein YjiS (DUF1127 family)